MRAGKLRHLVTLFLPPSNAIDTFGDVSETYTAGQQFWASIEPLSGRELWFASQLRADVTHKITLRGRAGVTAKCQIRWTDSFLNTTRIFEIGPPLSTDEKHREVVLTAVEKQL